MLGGNLYSTFQRYGGPIAALADAPSFLLAPHCRLPVALSRATLGTLLIVAVIAATVAVPYLLFPHAVGSYSLGILAGIPSGFMISLALYWVSGPSFRFRIVPSNYDGVSAGHWVHLEVSNTSWNVLGSGTAFACTGKVRFEGLPELATSWASRPNPRRDLPVTLPDGRTLMMSFADPLMFEQKRTETIRPGDSKSLDIAWRPKGSEFCHPSIPEHFQGPSIVRYNDLKLGPGEHPFTLRIDHQGGASKVHRFVLVVKPGTDLTWDSVYIKPAG